MWKKTERNGLPCWETGIGYILQYPNGFHVANHKGQFLWIGCQTLELAKQKAAELMGVPVSPKAQKEKVIKEEDQRAFTVICREWFENHPEAADMTGAACHAAITKEYNITRPFSIQSVQVAKGKAGLATGRTRTPPNHKPTSNTKVLNVSRILEALGEMKKLVEEFGVDGAQELLNKAVAE